MKNLTRWRVIQVWFVAVALFIVGSVALGLAMTFSTGVMLVALCLVPPMIVLKLWPGVQPPTASEVLSGADRRA